MLWHRIFNLSNEVCYYKVGEIHIIYIGSLVFTQLLFYASAFVHYNMSGLYVETHEKIKPHCKVFN